MLEGEIRGVGSVSTAPVVTDTEADNLYTAMPCITSVPGEVNTPREEYDRTLPLRGYEYEPYVRRHGMGHEAPTMKLPLATLLGGCVGAVGDLMSAADPRQKGSESVCGAMGSHVCSLGLYNTR
jgi:hypothetical protein